MMRFVRRASSALAAVALVASPLLAQASAVSARNDTSIAAGGSARETAQAAAAVSLAPRNDALSAGVRPRAMSPAPIPSPLPAPGQGDTSQNRALMIVGGAALIVGAIIGGRAGTIIMVGGAVVGLYGLYKFLE